MESAVGLPGFLVDAALVSFSVAALEAALALLLVALAMIGCTTNSLFSLSLSLSLSRSG